jgi:hypothetical protein
MALRCLIRPLAFILVVASAAAAEIGPPARDPDAVREAIRSHYRKLKSIEVVTTGTQTRSGRLFWTFKVTSRIDLDPASLGWLINRFYVDEDSKTAADDFGPDQRGSTQRIHSYDRSTGLSLYCQLSSDPSYAGGPSALVRKSYGESIIGDWMNAVFPAPGSGLEYLLQESDIYGPVEWNGRRVYVIDAFCGKRDAADKKRNATFYVDPQRDFAMCYYEWRRNDDGRKVRTIEIPDFVCKDGLWLPAGAQFNEYWISDEPPKTECRMEYLRVNPTFSDDDFRIHWPPGTYVQDKIVGVNYEIPAAGELPAVIVEWSPEPYASATGARPSQSLLSTEGDVPTPAAPAGPSISRRSILPAFALAIIILVAALLLLRSRRNA